MRLESCYKSPTENHRFENADGTFNYQWPKPTSSCVYCGVQFAKIAELVNINKQESK